MHLKIDRLYNVKAKGILGLIQSAKLSATNGGAVNGTAREHERGKEKAISLVAIKDAQIITYRKRSSKSSEEKVYQTMHLKNMINLE